MATACVPWDEGGTFLEPVFRTQVAHILRDGTKLLYIFGTAGEGYAVSETEFEALVENGSFVMHWHAHGLFYGIPTTIKHQLDHGKDCLINLSRDMLQRAENIFPTVVVLNLTAAPQTIAQRLVSRNRETQDEIARRLNAATKTLPDGLNVLHLSNDGPLAETVARGIALLCPDSEAIPVDVQGKTPNTKNSETAS